MRLQVLCTGIAICTAFAPLLCTAQEDEVSKWYATTSDSGFGSQIVTGADFNADGSNDYLIASPGNGSPRVGAFKADHTSLYTITPSDEWRSMAITNDLNSDGIKDIVVGSHRSSCTSTTEVPKVFFYSGVNGSLTYTLTGPTKSHFGDSVVVIGDKLIVSAPKLTQQSPPPMFGVCNTAKGAFYVYSASSKSLLYSVGGAAFGDRLGIALGDVGDVNNDGVSDFAVGTVLGPVYVYSGASSSASLLFTASSLSALASSGRFEAFRDFNSDGYNDFLIGVPDEDTMTASDIGTVLVVSGYNGALLSQVWGAQAHSFLGGAVKRVADINGDGITDFAVTASGLQDTGINVRAYLAYYSGYNLDQIGINYENYADVGANSGYSMNLAAPGDLNGDGKPDLFVGTPSDNEKASYLGSIRVSTTASCEIVRIPNVGAVCL